VVPATTTGSPSTSVSGGGGDLPAVEALPAAEALPQVVRGGGGNAHPTNAHPTNANAIVPAGSHFVDGGGEDLPFTGIEQQLLIVLAGMFAPIGVLLYCGARRGDRRILLSMPRFQWASPNTSTPAHPARPSATLDRASLSDPAQYRWMGTPRH